MKKRIGLSLLNALSGTFLLRTTELQAHVVMVTIHRARDRRGKLWIATVEILFSVLADRSQMNKMDSHRIHYTRAKSRKGDILVSQYGEELRGRFWGV
ncbi:hypothetical protein EDD85DRAFT_382899 [Armillaria nabsnona]|nr:hypothetical protein EDD85DRAFT_382899 [Armillaria nabsnona]